MESPLFYPAILLCGLAVFSLVDAYAAALILALAGAGVSGFAACISNKLLLGAGFFCSLLSLYIFADSVCYFYSATIFLNLYFTGAVFLVLAALFTAHQLGRVGEEPGRGRVFSFLAVILFTAAASLWYACGVREIVTQIIFPDRLTGLLLFTSGSSIFFGILEEKTKWQILGWFFYLQLPVMFMLPVLAALWNWPQDHLLFGWSVAFFVQYRILWVFERCNSKIFLIACHLGTLFLFYYISATLFPPTLLVPFFWSVLFLGLRIGSLWPVKSYPAMYLWCTVSAVLLFFISSITRFF